MEEYKPLLSKQEVEAFIGRSLSEAETTNFNIYSEIAETKLKGMLCLDTLGKDAPADLKMLLAKVFGSIKATQDFEAENGVASKRVEDFSVNYSADRKSPLESVLMNERGTLAKYSQCQSEIVHGRTIYSGDDRI